MPESHGADVRQSPYVSKLAGIEPEGVTALAAAALDLFGAINQARLVVNPALALEQAAATSKLLESLYPLQDAIHGSSGEIRQLFGSMRTEDLITSIKEAFGQHPEDVLAPAKVADEGFGWLNEILVSIRREAEGENCSTRIVKLADAGAYLAVDLENYCGSESESMLRKLQEVGILGKDERRALADGWRRELEAGGVQP